MGNKSVRANLLRKPDDPMFIACVKHLQASYERIPDDAKNRMCFRQSVNQMFERYQKAVSNSYSPEEFILTVYCVFQIKMSDWRKVDDKEIKEFDGLKLKEDNSPRRPGWKAKWTGKPIQNYEL